MKIANDQLSKTEINCLYWYGQGKTAKEIGLELNLTKKTVENYLLRVREKMQVNKSIQAVIKAIMLGLIKL